MTNKEFIKNEIKDLDWEVMFTIIECCKQLAMDGKPLYEWCEDEVMDVLDKVMDGFDY